MVRMNLIFIFILSSDPKLLRKKISKTKNEKNDGLIWFYDDDDYCISDFVNSCLSTVD